MKSFIDLKLFSNAVVDKGLTKKYVLLSSQLSEMICSNNNLILVSHWRAKLMKKKKYTSI